MDENNAAGEVSESAALDEAVPAEGDSRFERRWKKRESALSGASGKELEAVSVAEIQAERDREKQRADDLFARLQHTMADLSNYRKRMEQEREDMARFASMLLVAELLPVLDNFNRALETIPEPLSQFTWLTGIMLIERQLQAILERQGLQPIDAMGQPFNPSLHEAIVEEATDEHAPGTIVGELQRGYMMHDRVLRPTLAKVAAAPESDATLSQETVTVEGVDSDLEADEALQPNREAGATGDIDV